MKQVQKRNKVMELIDKNELLEKFEELKQNLSASPIVVITDKRKSNYEQERKTIRGLH